MFRDSERFNQPIGEWGVSKANNTRYMFRGAESFNPENASWYDE